MRIQGSSGLYIRKSCRGFSNNTNCISIVAELVTKQPLFLGDFELRQLLRIFKKCSSTALVAISPPMTDLVVATATATPTTTKVHGSEEVEDPTVDSTRSPGIRILRWWVMGSLHIQFLGYLFDGHNGFSAAIYSKENLLNNVLSAIPPYLNRDEWIATLPRALVDGLVKTDKDFQEKGLFSLNRPVAALEFYALAICRSCHKNEAAGSNRGNGLAVMVGQD
ncbi:hypothetical protein JHK84_027958 [Glycine max]|nr:hypothetical protein JHK84_027958 [Glycine max]